MRRLAFAANVCTVLEPGAVVARPLAILAPILAFTWLVLAGLLFGGLCRPAAAAEIVDAKIVFAVDASDSIEPWEWRLELGGIAKALRSPAVQEAIAALPHRRIAISMLIWADAGAAHLSTGWRLIDGKASAEAFADEVEIWPRQVGGGTAMGEGIAASIRLLQSAPYEARRQVIDVSGDGPEPLQILSDASILMPEAKAMAERAGVIVNGLAITKDRPDLVDWYRYNVLSGPGAFLMNVKSMRDFAPAFEAKLLRELQAEVAMLDGR